jgi:hypothetical protein
MEEEGRSRGRLRTFVLGGVVGASAAIAAARRVGPPGTRRRRPSPVGLAAFESAPCFEETIVDEALSRVPGGPPRR